MEQGGLVVSLLLPHNRKVLGSNLGTGLLKLSSAKSSKAHGSQTSRRYNEINRGGGSQSMGMSGCKVKERL